MKNFNPALILFMRKGTSIIIEVCITSSALDWILLWHNISWGIKREPRMRIRFCSKVRNGDLVRRQMLATFVDADILCLQPPLRWQVVNVAKPAGYYLAKKNAEDILQ